MPVIIDDLYELGSANETSKQDHDYKSSMMR